MPGAGENTAAGVAGGAGGGTAAARVTVTVVVWVVVPLGAVTTTVSVFAPVARLIKVGADPLVVLDPLTVTVAPARVAVGVTVMLAVSAGTAAV
jgi:hypothetical protein